MSRKSRIFVIAAAALAAFAMIAGIASAAFSGRDIPKSAMRAFRPDAIAKFQGKAKSKPGVWKRERGHKFRKAELRPMWKKDGPPRAVLL